MAVNVIPGLRSAESKLRLDKTQKESPSRRLDESSPLGELRFQDE